MCNIPFAVIYLDWDLASEAFIGRHCVRNNTAAIVIMLLHFVDVSLK